MPTAKRIKNGLYDLNGTYWGGLEIVEKKVGYRAYMKN